jgi:hypothetical protein
MKMKFYCKNFDVWLWEIYLLPTIKLGINEPQYCDKNISLEFHFLFIHIRILWFAE